MPLGALLGGIGGIMAGNKAANGAMDAGAALVGAADVANTARLGAYDASRTLDSQNLQNILANNRDAYQGGMSDQRNAYQGIMSESRDLYGDTVHQNRAGFSAAQGYLNPMMAQGDQYRAAMAYNDGFGDRPEGYAEFTGTPGYQFRRSEADDALNNRLAAMGSLNSGAAVRRAMEVADGMASQEHQLHYNRLASGANQGNQARYAMVDQRNRLTDGNNAARGNLAGTRNAARSNYANNTTNLRGGYAAGNNAAMNASTGNQMNLLNLRGESLANRATDAANAYASARMGATAGQTQAMQAGFGMPGAMISEGLQMAGGISGMGGLNNIGNSLMNGQSSFQFPFMG